MLLYRQGIILNNKIIILLNLVCLDINWGFVKKLDSIYIIKIIHIVLRVLYLNRKQLFHKPIWPGDGVAVENCSGGDLIALGIIYADKTTKQ